MLPSSCTPEGELNWCRVCRQGFVLEHSQPTGDACCPHCGSLAWMSAPSPPVDFTSWFAKIKAAKKRVAPPDCSEITPCAVPKYAPELILPIAIPPRIRTARTPWSKVQSVGLFVAAMLGALAGFFGIFALVFHSPELLVLTFLSGGLAQVAFILLGIVEVFFGGLWFGKSASDWGELRSDDLNGIDNPAAR